MKSSRCQRCRKARRIPLERYCRKCRAAVLSELARSGYLQWVPPPTAPAGGGGRYNGEESEWKSAFLELDD